MEENQPIDLEQKLQKAEKQRAKLLSLAKPLMEWLADNFHPHTKVIITNTDAEVVEGIICTGQQTDHLQD